MRHLCIASAVALLATAPLVAQQPVLIPANTYHRTLLSVAVYDPQVAIAVGDDGMILRTQDGGTNWWRIFAGSNAVLEDVTFNGVAVVAVGTGGTILRSPDGGVSWQLVFGGVSSRLKSVHFGDALHGIIVGDSGVALLTQDGGTTWARSYTGVVTRLVDVRMSGPATAVAVGYSGAILRTDDGGRTWRRLAVPTGATLTGVTMTGAASAAAVGLTGTALYTADGANWFLANSGTTQAMSDVVQADPATLFSAGSTATIIRSGDGGRTWQLAFQGNGFAFEDVNFADARNGWAVGNGGVIMRTTDGGVTWAHQMGVPGTSVVSAALPVASLYLQVLGLSVAAPGGSGAWTASVSSSGDGTRMDELRAVGSAGEAYLLSVVRGDHRTCAQIMANLITQGGQMRTAPAYTPPGWFQVSVEQRGTSAFVCLPLASGVLLGGFTMADVQRADAGVMRPVLVSIGEAAFQRWGRP